MKSAKLRFLFFSICILIALTSARRAWSSQTVFCPQDNTSTALVIIDMQPQFLNRLNNPKQPDNIQKIDALLTQQLALIEKAKENKLPIIFVTYDGDFGRTHYSLINAVTTYYSVRFFKKNSDSMFDSYNFDLNQLARYFNEFKIGHLIVAGINGDSCVLQSVRGALKNNCSVTLFTPGVASINYSVLNYPYSILESKKLSNVQCQNCSYSEVANLSELQKALDSQK